MASQVVSMHEKVPTCRRRRRMRRDELARTRRYSIPRIAAPVVAVILLAALAEPASAAAGSADTTFSGDGFTATAVSDARSSWANAVALQTGGKIVVAGTDSPGVVPA